MQAAQLLRITVLVLFITGCASAPEANDASRVWFGTNKNPAADLSGEWRWACCEGTYSGELTLLHDGNKLLGEFHDFSTGTDGTLTGTVRHNFIQLTRSFDDQKQEIKVAVSPDGATLTGIISGTGAVGPWSAEFDAKRK